jgi:NAD(P)-dependent dehydrogenase (short-subunit alcohol dehydrogenase family)
MEFSGRIAVITGGVSGIGAATAQVLRREGATAVTWDLDATADVTCDVSREADIEAAMNDTIADWGTPSLVVAAAGVSSASAFVDTRVEEWDRVLSINLRGVFLTFQHVARAMIAAQLDGSFIAISSVNGVLSDPRLVSYSTSKAAVNHMVRIAATELGRHGIRVNSVGPGPTATPMLEPRMTDEYLADVARATPLGHVGTAVLVAEGACNILRSDWITGQVVQVDGGASLMSARGLTRSSTGEHG